MDKENIQKINEIMKRFDPLLVNVAIGEIGVKSELIQKEVANIREALKKFNKTEVMTAGADYVGSSSMAFSCGGPVCICPKDVGCGKYTIRTDADQGER